MSEDFARNPGHIDERREVQAIKEEEPASQTRFTKSRAESSTSAYANYVPDYDSITKIEFDERPSKFGSRSELLLDIHTRVPF